MTYRIGAKYVATERLDVRMGIYYDQSPIRKHNYNPETPGMGKLGFSTGLSFEPYQNLQIDCAFLYIQESEEMAHTLTNTVPTVFSQDTTIHMPSRLR